MYAELIHRLEDVYLRAATPNDQRTIIDAIAALSATPQAAPLDALKAAAKYGWEHPRWDLDAVLIGVEERFAATPQAAQVPEGYALVPVEPTEAMRLAGIQAASLPTKVWAAMLAAAQAQGVGRG